jgi:hypothetical protein
LYAATVVARSGAVVGLHEAWVHDAVVGGWYTDATVAFLHYDCEDESRIDALGGRDRLDRGVYVVDFVGGVVRDVPLSTGACHDGLVGGEPIYIVSIIL